MRWSALTIVFVMACTSRPLELTSSSGTTSGSTTSGSTTSGSTTSGSTTSGSTTFGTSGTSGTTGSGSGAACDVAAQDCANGLKCVGQWDDQFTTLSGVCVADGSTALGQPCSNSASTTFMYDDDCQKGLICDDLYGNAPLLCRKICTTDAACGSGQKCGDFTYGMAGWGWCASTCTPFSAAAGGCPSGADCAEGVQSVEQNDPNGGVDGFFFCKKTGTGALFASCGSDADCAANLWCGSLDQNGTLACIPNCNDTMMCPSVPADAGFDITSFTCQPYANTPEHAGYCSPF